MDVYRLTEKDRDDLSLLLWREGMTRWYQEYRAYKEDLAKLKVRWRKWKDDVLLLGKSKRHLWPEPPEAASYPQSLSKVHRGPLKVLLRQKLRESGAAAFA